MENHDTELSRPEFLKLVITKATPFLLALAAVLIGLFVYNIFDSSNVGFQVFLIFILLLLFFYPILKRRYGERIWNSLPPFVQQIALGIRIVALVLLICFFFLLGLSMPLLLVLACIYLMVDNYKLKEELEKSREVNQPA
jgi:hypothetical protein